MVDDAFIEEVLKDCRDHLHRSANTTDPEIAMLRNRSAIFCLLQVFEHIRNMERILNA